MSNCHDQSHSYADVGGVRTYTAMSMARGLDHPLVYIHSRKRIIGSNCGSEGCPSCAQPHGIAAVDRTLRTETVRAVISLNSKVIIGLSKAQQQGRFPDRPAFVRSENVARLVRA